MVGKLETIVALVANFLFLILLKSWK